MGLYGEFLLLNKEYAAAAAAFYQSVQINPDNYNYWESLVSADSQMQNGDSLVKHTEAALEFYPNQAMIWFYNGTGYLILRNYRRAVEAFERTEMLAAGSENLELLFRVYAQLGDSYNGVRDYERSDNAYEKALGIRPEAAYVLNNYSYYLSLRKDKTEKAIKMCKKLISLDPDNPTYLDTYGWVLFGDKSYKEAAKYLGKAANNSESATISEHYGDVLLKLGRDEEAVKWWRKAKENGGPAGRLDKKNKRRPFGRLKNISIYPADFELVTNVTGFFCSTVCRKNRPLRLEGILFGKITEPK